MTIHETQRTELFSIGVVAERTGILDTTLRIWERRYGTPRPVRLASGHRRYTADQIVFLRRVSEALCLGLRAGNVLRRSQQDLESLIAERRSPEIASLPRDWETWVRAFDRESLENALDRARIKLGLAPFLDDCVRPMLVRVGSNWEEGVFEIRHESFVSETVDSHLRALRDRKDVERRPAERGRVLIASLPDERHALGLQLVACACSDLSVGYDVLGASMSLEDIDAASRALSADAVAISISRGASVPASLRAINELRRMLPPGQQLVIGGDGASRFRRSPPGTSVLPSIAEAQDWLRSLRSDLASQPGNSTS